MNINIGRKQYLNFAATTSIGADPVTWFGILHKHWRDVSWQFWPKVLMVSCFVCLIWPLILWEKLRYGRQIRGTKVQKPLFIIGHQRSGTTYLYYLLARDPQFAYLSVKEGFMPWIFLTSGRWLRKMLVRALPEKRPMDGLKLGIDLPTEPEYTIGNMTTATMLPGYTFPNRMLEVFRKNVLMQDRRAALRWASTTKYFLQKLSMATGNRPLLLKSPENLGRVKELLELFPGARFIHIYRDPYTVYTSTERLYEVTLPMVSLQHVHGEVVEEFILSSYTELFDKYFSDRALIPSGQLAEIRYEDLIGNEVEVLRNAYAQLGLPGFGEAEPLICAEIKEYTNYKTNRYSINEPQKRKVMARWQDVASALDYGV